VHSFLCASTAAHLVQHTLRTPNLALPLLDDRCGVSDSNSQRLESTLCPVVVVVSPDAINMQCSPAVLRKALQTMRNHLRTQVAQLLPLKPQIRNAVRPIAQIDDRATQRLVERRIRMSEAREACASLQRILERRAERQERVLSCVVVVDVQVALDPDSEGPASVLGEGVDHVVEEADAGVDLDLLGGGLLCGMLFVDLLAFAVQVLFVVRRPEVGVFVGGELAAVEVDGDLDFGLVGVFVEGCGARHGGGGDCVIVGVMS
jgi:hypothetical protein